MRNDRRGILDGEGILLRVAAMNEDRTSGEHSDGDRSERACPNCNAVLEQGTVLCVACGYHLKLARQLDTVVDSEPALTPKEEPLPPDDGNPYASPRTGEPAVQEGGVLVQDLTEAGAKRARAVVADSKSVIWVVCLAWCVCAPAWFLMLPWYAYRLYCWYDLNGTFGDLRSPNALSPHGELAMKFQDARSRLLLGVIVGAVLWLLMGRWVAVELGGAR